MSKGLYYPGVIENISWRSMIDAKQSPQAPDFSATDSEGKVIQLSDYRGKKNVVLVFNRGFF